MAFVNTSVVINFEPWFIPMDIISIICVVLAMGLAALFTFIILVDKTCRTVSMMLVANTCLAEILFGIIMFGLRVFALENDLKRIAYTNLFCNFLGYMAYVSCSIQNFSCLIQAIHRFIIIVHPSRLFFQSIRFQFLLICLSWIFGFLYPIVFLFNNEIIYNVNNQICQLPLRLSFSVIYMANCAYIIPVSLTIFIYFKVVRYVRKMSKRVTPANVLFRVRRELKMVRRTVILVSIIVTICFPYTLFILLSFFIKIPIYHFRIAAIFIDVSLLFVMIALFQFTDLLKTSIRKRIITRSNVIIPKIG